MSDVGRTTRPDFSGDCDEIDCIKHDSRVRDDKRLFKSSQEQNMAVHACASACETMGSLGLTTVHEEGDYPKKYKTCDNSNCGSHKAII